MPLRRPLSIDQVMYMVLHEELLDIDLEYSNEADNDILSNQESGIIFLSDST